MISEDTVYTRKKRLPWRELEGSVVIVDVETEACISLNEVASTIWLAIDGSAGFGEIINKIIDDYEISREQAQEDAEKFLNELLKQGHIHCATAQNFNC